MYTVALASQAAAEAADPVLTQVMGSDGESPNGNNVKFNKLDCKPYRYIGSAYMKDTTSSIEGRLKEKVKDLDSGFFVGMKAQSPTVEMKPNMKFIYSKVTVKVSYNIKMPIRLLFSNEDFIVDMNSVVDIPVTDVPEFIRNVDYVDDLIQKYTGGDLSTPMNIIKEHMPEYKGVANDTES